MLEILDEDPVGRSFNHRLLASGDLVERFGHLMKDAVQFGNLIVAGQGWRQLLARRQVDRIVSELLQAPADAPAEQERENARQQDRRGRSRDQQPAQSAATTRRGFAAAPRPGVLPPARTSPISARICFISSGPALPLMSFSAGVLSPLLISRRISATRCVRLRRELLDPAGVRALARIVADQLSQLVRSSA